jgi:SAM-dependent methyltransferase
VSEQQWVNDEIWRRGDFVAEYAHRNLTPAEVIVLARYRESFAGSVLELGCGAGRLTGYVIELGGKVLGTDIAEPMVEYCRQAYPGATFRVEDLRDLSGHPEGAFDVVLAANNLFDVLDDVARRGVLTSIMHILHPGGLLVMSTHNRAYEPQIPEPLAYARKAGRIAALRRLPRVPAWRRSRRRLRPLERDEPEYAVLNDEAHGYRLLHYYIGRDAQERQLAGAGLELVECLDGNGRVVAAGEAAERHSELYYVARRPVSDDGPQ